MEEQGGPRMLLKTIPCRSVEAQDNESAEPASSLRICTEISIREAPKLEYESPVDSLPTAT